MPSSGVSAPSSVTVGELLACHPDAASLLSEASHRDLLATQAEASARLATDSAREARLRFIELKHKLDPRDQRPLRAEFGLAVLFVVTVGLMTLDAMLLADALGARGPSSLPMCATTTWLIAAWRGALAAREGDHRLSVSIATGAAALSVLFGLVHFLNPGALSSPGFDATALTVLLVDALTFGAWAIIARMEPMSATAARMRWKRADRRARRAERQRGADVQAAEQAIDRWLDLVRRHAAADQQEPVAQALSIAATLLTLGRDCRPLATRPA